MANITINIKNCGCGGSTSKAITPTVPGSGTGENWGDPASPSGPPDGYFTPTSGLSDRQCKTAVWLFDWTHGWLEWLATTYQGSIVVGAIKRIDQIQDNLPWLASLLIPAAAGVAGVFGLFIGGLDPSDAVIAWLARAMAASLLVSLAQVESHLITQPLLQNALEKIEPFQDEIICRLSKASTVEGALQTFQNILEDTITDLTPEQQALIFGLVPRELFALLFYTSDYWPSFDDDYLAGITATCCGDYVDGDVIEAGSDQACAAATYLVDQLIALCKTVGQAGHGIWSDFNPFDSLKADYRDHLETNITGYPKIKAKANWNGFLNHLTEHVYLNRGWFFQFADALTLWEYYDVDGIYSGDDHLASRLQTQRSAAINALFTAADKDAAYSALDAIIDAEIDLIDTDDQLKALMKSAIEALINPQQSTLLDLLYTQDADLYGYPGDCGPGLDEPPADGNLWYPVGINTCEPVSIGNCDNGDGQPDGLYTNAISVGYHQVEFYPITITSETRIDAWYASQSSGYGQRYISAKIDGEWVTLNSASNQSSSGGWTGLSIGGYDGQILSGLRLGFSNSKFGHSFAVGGYRIQNYNVSL